MWFRIAPGDHPGVTVTRLTPLDFSRELAAVRLDDAVIAPENLLTGLDTSRVRDLAATMYAAEAAGVAAWCSATAADYARTRHQFGRPIGSFQAVKHLCATMACRAERAAALAWDAARAADEAPAEHPLAAAAAAALALDDAVDNAKDCIQVLGGIGFTWEHDAHLYLRRALALRQLLGGSPGWRTRTGTLAAAGARRQPRAVKPEPEESPYQDIGAWAGPAIAKYGTQQQQDRFLGPTRRAEIAWCQLFSEPEAGSDLAGLRTRARPAMKGDGPGGTGGGSPPGTEKAGGGWLLTGQKVWTSLARQADWAICLARTDPEVPKHEGITFFLVDMHAPGIDVRPLREITGRVMFNEVFLDDVFVRRAPGDPQAARHRAPPGGRRDRAGAARPGRRRRGGGRLRVPAHPVPVHRRRHHPDPAEPDRRTRPRPAPMMDFSLAESQQAVAGLAAQVLADPKADAWKELAQAGLLALSVPAQLGGDGLGVLEVAVLLTEIGRRARPGPPPKSPGYADDGRAAGGPLGQQRAAAGAASGRRGRRADPHRGHPRAVGPGALPPGHRGHRRALARGTGGVVPPGQHRLRYQGRRPLRGAGRPDPRGGQPRPRRC